jgi:hypothetical protein
MDLFKKALLLSGLAAGFVMGCASSGGSSSSTPGASAAAQPTGAPLQLPEGMIAIHYYRPNGDYSGWGLHTWESFQPKEEAGDEWAKKTQADRQLPGVSWFAPRKPNGTDDFGEYWLVAANEYGNGRVNYIIHNGDKKDQCNQDKFFLIQDTKEVWVNSGQCKTYHSKEEALKARK